MNLNKTHFDTQSLSVSTIMLVISESTSIFFQCDKNSSRQSLFATGREFHRPTRAKANGRQGPTILCRTVSNRLSSDTQAGIWTRRTGNRTTPPSPLRHSWKWFWSPHDNPEIGCRLVLVTSCWVVVFSDFGFLLTWLQEESNPHHIDTHIPCRGVFWKEMKRREGREGGETSRGGRADGGRKIYTRVFIHARFRFYTSWLFTFFRFLTTVKRSRHKGPTPRRVHKHISVTGDSEITAPLGLVSMGTWELLILGWSRVAQPRWSVALSPREEPRRLAALVCSAPQKHEYGIKDEEDKDGFLFQG